MKQSFIQMTTKWRPQQCQYHRYDKLEVEISQGVASLDKESRQPRSDENGRVSLSQQ